MPPLNHWRVTVSLLHRTLEPLYAAIAPTRKVQLGAAPLGNGGADEGASSCAAPPTKLLAAKASAAASSSSAKQPAAAAAAGGAAPPAAAADDGVEGALASAGRAAAAAVAGAAAGAPRRLAPIATLGEFVARAPALLRPLHIYLASDVLLLTKVVPS